MELPEKRQLGCSVMSRFLRLEKCTLLVHTFRKVFYCSAELLPVITDALVWLANNVEIMLRLKRAEAVGRFCKYSVIS